MSVNQKLSVAKNKANRLKPKWPSHKHTCNTARNLKILGLSDAEIATIFGILPRQIARWKENSPKLREAIAEGKKNLHDRLVAQMVTAAAGYDYDEVRTKRNSVGKIIDETTTTKHVPANAPLFMFLMTNQWGDPTENWKGWKIRRDSALPNNRITIQIDGKTEAAKISKLAGKLFGSDTDEPARKLIVATEVSEDADRGHGVEKGLSGAVSVEAPDSVQVDTLDFQSEA